MKRRSAVVIIIVLAALALAPAWARQKRRANPITTAAAMTQAVNETEGDTARLNAQMRKRPVHYVNNNGFMVYVDSVTGDEWIDSTVIPTVPKMEYPLLESFSIGINIWDPMMRIFGQHYGIGEAWAEVSLHNRYKPIIEVGLGNAYYTPPGMNYTYSSPLSVYFRIGANYNFLFNSNPDYSFFAGVRYGIAPFTYSIEDVTVTSGYWGDSSHFSIPSQRATVGWAEVTGGVRVKLWGPISAGWTVRYKSVLHRSRTPHGAPWYVPGFGTPGAISGSFSIIYTLSLAHLNKPKTDAVINDGTSDGIVPAEPSDNSINE